MERSGFARTGEDEADDEHVQNEVGVQERRATLVRANVADVEDQPQEHQREEGHQREVARGEAREELQRRATCAEHVACKPTCEANAEAEQMDGKRGMRTLRPTRINRSTCDGTMNLRVEMSRKDLSRQGAERANNVQT
jgi:hypothetical protein